MKILTKGFTIIELLVVVAIIAVLAAIVLINVTGYINKGKDTAAKGDMGTLLTDAANYYTSNSTFDGIASDPDYSSVIDGLEASSMGYDVTTTCDQNDDCTAGTTANLLWCACIKEKASAAYYCVDASGRKSEQTAHDCAATCVAGECIY